MLWIDGASFIHVLKRLHVVWRSGLPQPPFCCLRVLSPHCLPPGMPSPSHREARGVAAHVEDHAVGLKIEKPLLSFGDTVSFCFVQGSLLHGDRHMSILQDPTGKEGKGWIGTMQRRGTKITSPRPEDLSQGRVPGHFTISSRQHTSAEEKELNKQLGQSAPVERIQQATSRPLRNINFEFLPFHTC